MLTWASPFNICCFLDNHRYASSTTAFECLLAVGAAETFSASAGEAFAGLKQWAAGRRDWMLGHFGFALSAETEGVPCPAADPVGFPALCFFIPVHLLILQQDKVRIGSLGADPATLWQEICHVPPFTGGGFGRPIALTARFDRDEYLATVEALRSHILRGDCYEINFCQEWFAQPADIDPYAVWQALEKVSPNPFSAFYRLGHRYLLCASPERFLRKSGNTLTSQPIKGTAPRRPADSIADQQQRELLRESAKDRAENVMVVDIVRNDLARICRPGSVQVAELFGIYAFPQVYQMISTVTGEMLSGLDWTDAVQACFPMASMTGAPKHRVLQLIARYERSGRGLYSGALGYVSPEGDFDFNVVIRSLLYDQDTQYLSYQVGSGITYYSDPAAEYEECLVKAEGIRKALGHS